jgi:predicted porin
MSFRIMSAAALFMSAAVYGGTSAPALAADLGGDCCADLEERVAELEATTVRKGNRKVSVELYGQVNTGLMYFDNGEVSDTYVIDNQTSNSRFGLKGEAKISPTLRAGFRIEIAAGLGAESNAVTELDDDGTAPGDSNVLVRQANWYLAHKTLGRLTVGRLQMSTDGVSEIDLGGANIVAQSGLYFGNDIAVGGLPGSVNFDTFAVGNFEFDRNNAVRYDTATFAGFQASVAWGEDDRWDAALRYAGELGGFRLAAGIGYGVDTDESPFVGGTVDERRILAGSASVLHVKTGLFLSGSAAQRTNELIAGGDFTELYWSVRGGISKNWFGIGKTVLYGEYHTWDTTDISTVADRAETDIWGLGVVQNIDAAAMELYLAYKNHNVDLVSGVPTDETHLVISGARVRF